MRTLRLAAEEPIRLLPPPPGTRPNHWLNAVRLESAAERDAWLEFSNARG